MSPKRKSRYHTAEAAHGPGSRFYVPSKFANDDDREQRERRMMRLSEMWKYAISIPVFFWHLVVEATKGVVKLLLFFVALMFTFIARAVVYLPSKLRPRRQEDDEYDDGDFFKRFRQARDGSRNKMRRASQNRPEDPPIVIPVDPMLAVERIMREDEHNLYRIVGCTRSASVDDMKKLFRRQSLLIHPDKNNHKVRAAV